MSIFDLGVRFTSFPGVFILTNIQYIYILINTKKKNNMNKTSLNLNPYWVTGFTDGEGCFMATLEKIKSSEGKFGVEPCFQIGLHSRDLNLLIQIKSFFGEIGTIYTYNNITVYKIINIDDILEVIIPHFDKYPLITQKQNDYIIWKKIINLIRDGKHLDEKGLTEILNLKVSFNKEMFDGLGVSFLRAMNIKRPKINTPKDIDLNWVAGFFSDERCFFINICKATDCNIGYSVRLEVILSQHFRDKALLYKLANVLKCGNVYKHTKRGIVSLVISNFEDIYYEVIPMFKTYNVKGVKHLYFEDFCLAAEIIKKKDHEKSEGMEQIKLIKSRMNKRKIY